MWRCEQSSRAEAQKLRNIPQRKVSPYECVLYALVFPLLLMAGAMPLTALILLPFVLPVLYLMYRRFGAYLPFSCVLCYGGLSLLFNYDVLTVVYFVFLLVALCGLILSAQLSPYLLCAAVAGIFAVAGALSGIGVVRLAENRPLGAVAEQYIIAEQSDPIIKFFSERYYERADIPDDIGRVDKTDERYGEACAEYLAEFAGRDFGEYSWYYCVHFGAIISELAYFISVIVNRRTASCYDRAATADEVSLSTRCLGGVRVEPKRIADMRVPRAYLWAVAGPALVAGIVLDIIGGYAALSATIIHLFVTIPSAYAFVTVAAFFAALFKSKRAAVAAHIVLGLILAAMLVFPMALFICSLIGVCDVILNLRFWANFIMRD